MRRALAFSYARSSEEAATITTALALLEREARYGPALSSPNAVRDYMRLSLGAREREVFACVWMDGQHRAICFEELFTGTLTQTSVFPREVVKAALRVNAAAVIFAHNHPAGGTEPSNADQALTETLGRALALVDVKVLDHFVVSTCGAMSFAERGLL